jgi:hypothetical protein
MPDKQPDNSTSAARLSLHEDLDMAVRVYHMHPTLVIRQVGITIPGNGEAGP